MSYADLLSAAADEVATWRSKGMPDAEVRTFLVGLWGEMIVPPIVPAEHVDEMLAGITTRIDEELAKPRNDAIPTTDGEPGLN